MKTRNIRIGKLEIRFNIFMTIFVLLLAAGLARLGIWQLSRANEKIAMQESFELKATLDPVPVDDLQLTGLANDTVNHQNAKVSLIGEYQNHRNIFLIFQEYRDQPGYEIIIPFKLDSNGTYVMVSRGWAMARSPEALIEKVQTIEGNLILSGQLHIPSEKEIDQTNNLDEDIQWPLFLRYLNTLELLPYFDSSIFPYVVRLDADQPGVMVRHWPTIYVETNHHYTYALQWFSMSIAVILAALYMGSNAKQVWNIKFRPDW